jgi:chemotaxis protein histidine kinase CheA
VLLEILRSEVAQYLQTIRTAVARADGELVVDDGLLRAVHTLHGAIAMVDIPLLTRLLSPLESLLKRLRGAGHPLSTEGVRLLGRSADVVDQVMAQFDAAQPQLPDADALTARLAELRDQEPEPQVAHVVFEPQDDEIAAVDTTSPITTIMPPISKRPWPGSISTPPSRCRHRLPRIRKMPRTRILRRCWPVWTKCWSLRATAPRRRRRWRHSTRMRAKAKRTMKRQQMRKPRSRPTMSRQPMPAS